MAFYHRLNPVVNTRGEVIYRITVVNYLPVSVVKTPVPAGKPRVQPTTDKIGYRSAAPLSICSTYFDTVA